MKKIPTAEELFDKMISENDEATSTEMMIEFAKLHVEVALKEASENAETKQCFGNIYDPDDVYYEVDKNSILTAYPLTNIK